jgi:hypothetical protein
MLLLAAASSRSAAPGGKRGACPPVGPSMPVAPVQRGLLLWLVLLAAGAVFALWPKESPTRPVPRDDVLLDTEVAMGEDGALFAFRVERPGTVEVDVDLVGPEGAGAATHVLLGPPASLAPPAGTGTYYPPDPKTAFRYGVEGERTPPVRRTIFGVGTYAIQVEPVPAAKEPPRVRVKVTVVP